LVGITLGQFVGDNGSSGGNFIGTEAGIGQKALNLGGIALKSAVQCGQIVVAGSKPDGPHRDIGRYFALGQAFYRYHALIFFNAYGAGSQQPTGCSKTSTDQ